MSVAIATCRPPSQFVSIVCVGNLTKINEMNSIGENETYVPSAALPFNYSLLRD